MAERLTFHAFTVFGWADGQTGLWRHSDLVPPRRVSELAWWIELAQLAERGRFDSLFFADAIGHGGFVPGDIEREIHGGRFLFYDPSAGISALAAATKDLGFLFTSSILQDHPFSFARRVSTLDELSGGRIGWNIVTSHTPNVARNFGLPDLPSREERYDWADEYVDVTYRLWEGSWEEGALVRNAETGMFADPSRVHTIDYAGQRYSVQGPHMSPPSPQRTPLLVQAGGSPPGRSFAARHAEMQFIAGGRVESMQTGIATVRKLAVDAGRRADDIAFVVSSQFIVGSTEGEARRKARDLDEKTDMREVAANLSTGIGIDLSGLDLDTPVTRLSTQNAGGMQGILDALVDSLPRDRTPTLAEVLRAQLDRRRVVGSPEQIADVLERWREAGVGGIALNLTLRPGSLTDFIEHAMPVLQQRGLAQREYTPGTLRRKIMGYGDRLPGRHPAARHRRPSGPA